MMSRNKLVVCFLVFIVTGVECWGYEKTEHKVFNEWIMDHSVGGFDFDQYTRQSLGIDGGMEESTLRYTYLFDWLTITGYRSPLAVGHLMHLIQDSSCPEHVRNSFEQVWGIV